MLKSVPFSAFSCISSGEPKKSAAYFFQSLPSPTSSSRRGMIQPGAMQSTRTRFGPRS
ncbi:hypothetical protein K2X89_13715 [Myxococcota bacterium]|nr:hypothetical protein [Myxococcota bacterium]